MPSRSAWNGKYEGVGNGGFAGSLIYAAMNSASGAGYATSGTDTGHSGGSLESRWALGHPEKIVDFGWRAIHETAQASKAIIEAYYGSSPTRAYFTGCSDGGREALMEAERFPADYDGIVAGAPANFWTRLMANAVWTEQALDEPDSWLSPEKLSLVTKAALAACHGEDGYFDDPGQCRFDPSSLVCKVGQTEACLSAPQLVALRKVYSGAVNASGKSILPGYAPGGEADPGAWVLWITGNERKRTAGTLMYGFGTGYFADMVFDKPDWRIDGQNVDDDLAAAVKKTGEAVELVGSGSQRIQSGGAQTHPVSRLERRGDPCAKLHRLLRVGSSQDGRSGKHPILLSPVHGAGDGSLRRRTRSERGRRRFRPARSSSRSRA